MWPVKNRIWLKNFSVTHNFKKVHVFPAASSAGCHAEESSSAWCWVSDAGLTQWVKILSTCTSWFEYSQLCVDSSLNWDGKLKCKGGFSFLQSLNLGAWVSLPPSHFDGLSSSEGSLFHLGLLPKQTLATLDGSEILTDERQDR